MKNRIVLSIQVFILFNIFSPVFADEGMWLPQLIEKMNYAEMTGMGLNLTAEEIYSYNNSSIKDAIVSFGGFCTAEVISQKGLLLTNHHCGYGAIAQNSSIENDYLTNGFWANAYYEELPAKGLFVKFLIRIEDVTEKVLSFTNFEMTEAERQEAIQKAIKEINADAINGTGYMAETKGFFYDNEFYLFVYEVYNDIRLVGAPPNSIGNFGGDTDNWMWPRHTGDFSLFRIYTSPDGKPAQYSKDNVPMQSKKWLPISLNGYEENDFAMIIGYPGSTSRYLTSYGVKTAYDYVNPAIIRIREKKLEIMATDMKTSDHIRLQYADKYATTANYYKYFIGQNKGIERLNVIERKKNEEDDFETWVNNANIPKTDFYADAIPLITMSYKQMPIHLYVYTYVREALLRGSEVIPFASKFRTLYEELKKEKPNITVIEEQKVILTELAHEFFAGFVKQTERRMFQSMLEVYFNDVRTEYHPDFFREIDKKYNNDFRIFSDMVFQTSLFTDSVRLYSFLKKPTLKAIENDPALIVSISSYDYMQEIQITLKALNLQLQKGMRKLLKGMMEMHTDKKFYPDANSTMRLTYGKVMGYQSIDAVSFNYITTIDGIMAKEDSSNPEFIVPQKLKELYQLKDYGRYANKDGNMPVCFLTNLDITGGNSGSPVLNGNGELIGVTFDANWEAMSMDIAYEPQLQRCISLDIRFVLFIIDKYAGASYLLEEMEIRKD